MIGAEGLRVYAGGAISGRSGSTKPRVVSSPGDFLSFVGVEKVVNTVVVGEGHTELLASPRRNGVTGACTADGAENSHPPSSRR